MLLMAMSCQPEVTVGCSLAWLGGRQSSPGTRPVHGPAWHAHTVWGRVSSCRGRSQGRCLRLDRRGSRYPRPPPPPPPPPLQAYTHPHRHKPAHSSLAAATHWQGCSLPRMARVTPSSLTAATPATPMPCTSTTPRGGTSWTCGSRTTPRRTPRSLVRMAMPVPCRCAAVIPWCSLRAPHWHGGNTVWAITAPLVAASSCCGAITVLPCCESGVNTGLCQYGDADCDGGAARTSATLQVGDSGP
jgi:hypothetical protein